MMRKINEEKKNETKTITRLRRNIENNINFQIWILQETSLFPLVEGGI